MLSVRLLNWIPRSDKRTQSACFAVKHIGKPFAGKLHARLVEGGQGETCSLLYPFSGFAIIVKEFDIPPVHY